MPKRFLPADYDNAMGLRDGILSNTAHSLEIKTEHFAVPPIYDAPDWVNHYQNFWLLRAAYELPPKSEVAFGCAFSTRQTFGAPPLPRDVLKCVTNVHEDIRLCAGSFQVIDPNTGLFFGFSQSNHSLMAVYGVFESLPSVGWAGCSSNLNFAAWKSAASAEEKAKFCAFAAQSGRKVVIASDSWSQTDPEVLKLWEGWRKGAAAESERRGLPPRCYYPHCAQWSGKKASFASAVEVARREGASPLAQFDEVEVAIRTVPGPEGLAQTVHFRVRGEEVFRVLYPGRRPEERHRMLEHGGYATDLVMSRVIVGFGVTSMLDASRPNNYGRKNFKCDYRMKTGLVQLAHHHRYYEIHHNYFGELENLEPTTAFAINDYNSEKDMKKALFGQGCLMRVKRYSMVTRPFPDDLASQSASVCHIQDFRPAKEAPHPAVRTSSTPGESQPEGPDFSRDFREAEIAKAIPGASLAEIALEQPRPAGPEAREKGDSAAASAAIQTRETRPAEGDTKQKKRGRGGPRGFDVSRILVKPTPTPTPTPTPGSAERSAPREGNRSEGNGGLPDRWSSYSRTGNRSSRAQDRSSHTTSSSSSDSEETQLTEEGR